MFTLILWGTFRRIRRLRDNAHTLHLENCLLYLSSIILQFADLIHCNEHTLLYNIQPTIAILDSIKWNNYQSQSVLSNRGLFPFFAKPHLAIRVVGRIRDSQYTKSETQSIVACEQAPSDSASESERRDSASEATGTRVPLHLCPIVADMSSDVM